MKKTLAILFIFSVFNQARAASLSASGEEVSYSYTIEFRTLIASSKKLSVAQATAQAKMHAGHLFGLLMSPELAMKAGYTEELIAGSAGPKAAELSQVSSYTVDGDEYPWVRYTGTGRMLVLNRLLKKWIGSANGGSVTLPMLRDLPAVYADEGKQFTDKKWVACGDKHYPDAPDFSYFYDPFRCPDLGRAPIAVDVKIDLKRVTPARAVETSQVPLTAFHDDNGNGSLTTFYFVYGFDAEPAAGDGLGEIAKDAGYKTKVATEKMLTQKFGFEKVEGLEDLRKRLGDDFSKISLLTPTTLANANQKRFFDTFVKKSGRETLVARLGLFRTDNEAGSAGTATFPQFWKEAWENGDFLYYGGHSQDGQALDLKTMLGTLKASDIAAIHFKPSKTQVAYFDACTSYDHFQSAYLAKKPKGLNLVTYGFVSEFHQAVATIGAMLDLLVSEPAAKPLRWMDALSTLEHDQLVAHVNYFYYAKDRESVLADFEKSHQAPSYLINVWDSP